MKVSILRCCSAACFCLGLIFLAGCNTNQDVASKQDSNVAFAPQHEHAETESNPLAKQPDRAIPGDSLPTEQAPVEGAEEPAAEAPALDALLDGDSTEFTPKKLEKPKAAQAGESKPLATPTEKSGPMGNTVTEHAYSVGQGEGGGVGYASESRSIVLFDSSGTENLEVDRQLQTEPSNRETYDSIDESPFKQVGDHPLSTFSIDVDTASYSNMRRILTGGQLPPAGAVRIEELVNYFTYNYPQPKGEAPFAADVEIAAAPWNEKHRLVRVGIQGRKIEEKQRPACNLVFLIDTSGSMRPANKLPLVVQSLLLLSENLTEKDRVAIVTYAGSAGVLLPAVAGSEQETINSAINGLAAGGSTNGAGGIRVAYEIARQNFNANGVNRVILATDGDFNVGVTNSTELVTLIEEEAKSGVFLSVLGFGMGNYNDSRLEKLADNGNGNYAYIDTINEGRKVLGEQMFGTLITIAKDVKIQIEFNPALVAAYRLIGYENRILQKEDFNDDKKDAGEIGAGHTVTALYEIVPVGVEVPASVDPLKYQKTQEKLSEAAKSDELFTLKLRYKEPAGDKSKLIEIPVKDQDRKFAAASTDFQFAASVASFGMSLRKSKHSGGMSIDGILEIARSAQGNDPSGYRAEFVQLVQRAKEMQR